MAWKPIYERLVEIDSPQERDRLVKAEFGFPSASPGKAAANAAALGMFVWGVSGLWQWGKERLEARRARGQVSPEWVGWEQFRELMEAPPLREFQASVVTLRRSESVEKRRAAAQELKSGGPRLITLGIRFGDLDSQGSDFWKTANKRLSDVLVTLGGQVSLLDVDHLMSIRETDEDAVMSGIHTTVGQLEEVVNEIAAVLTASSGAQDLGQV